ncbi:hypothetical protein OG625_22865 [Streptomyces sp. NBC_01351]|uniref:three-helix bundle dimerization domain-containing protein n=1 Tax=Streptomyces sp. NBC_01351 TaxID=2903833 RepID=UPI002E2F8129|nr:hypothetical protein [Streptomyces sp. NBC_01351]
MEDRDALRTAPQESAALREAEQRLHRRFDATTGPDAVESAVAEARARFDGSKIRTFVPILVERRAADTLKRLGTSWQGADHLGAALPAGRPPSPALAGRAAEAGPDAVERVAAPSDPTGGRPSQGRYGAIP